MANGHGGKRTGAGRPRKSLADKLFEGTARKHKPKVLNLPSLEDFPAPEMPDYLRQMTCDQAANFIPNTKAIFDETIVWLEKTGCLHLINPALIIEYTLMKTRWLECEDFIRRGVIVKDKNDAPAPNPMIDSAIKYSKAADSAWSSIWNIIASNSEVYFGDDPNGDVMAFLIKNKPER